MISRKLELQKQKIADCKSRKLELQKLKMADNVSNSTVFWKELSKLNPTNKVSSNQIDDASGSIEISKLFHAKYRLLYSSVPTDTKELDDLHIILNNGITPNDHVMITPAKIRQCVSRLKSGNPVKLEYGFDIDTCVFRIDT